MRCVILAAFVQLVNHRKCKKASFVAQIIYSCLAQVFHVSLPRPEQFFNRLYEVGNAGECIVTMSIDNVLTHNIDQVLRVLGQELDIVRENIWGRYWRTNHGGDNRKHFSDAIFVCWFHSFS